MAKIDIKKDFSLCVDSLESVILRRRDSITELPVEAAYCLQCQTKESTPNGAGALQADAVWHLQFAAADTTPEIGDVLVDQQQNRWTILESQQLTMLGRWKCVTRELRIANGCHELVDIDRAVWGDLGAGPVIVDWEAICRALPVRIQPGEMALDSSNSPPTKQLYYQIILSESPDLEPDDRLTTQEGVSYRLQTLQQAYQIDALPIANVLREENS